MMKGYIKILIENIYPYLKNKSQILVDNLDRILKKNNIDIEDLGYLGSGESAISFTYNDKVIKLSFVNYKGIALSEYISDSDSILQLELEEEFEFGEMYKGYILMNQKLDTNNIKKSDILELYKNLKEDGYYWLDTRITNVGKNKEGKPLLLDYGELINTRYYSNRELDKIEEMNAYRNEDLERKINSRYCK